MLYPLSELGSSNRLYLTINNFATFIIRSIQTKCHLVDWEHKTTDLQFPTVSAVFSNQITSCTGKTFQSFQKSHFFTRLSVKDNDFLLKKKKGFAG